MIAKRLVPLALASSLPMFACNLDAVESGAEALAAANKSTKTVGSLQDLFGFSDNAITLDTTLLDNTPLADTAEAIRTRLAAQTGGCTDTMISVNGPTVTAEFPSTGCSMGKVTTKGSVSFEAVSVLPASVRMTATNLDVNGETMNGSVTFTTDQPGSMNVGLDLMNRGTTQAGTLNVKVQPAIPPELTFGGSVASTDSEGTTNFTLTDVSWKVGDCYPSGGNVKVNDDVTVKFDDQTKTDGKVKVEGENFEGSTNLPSYANCQM